MEAPRSAAPRDAGPATAAPAQVAKAALRRLALAHLEPTPENYALAFDEEMGIAPRPVLPGRAVALLEKMAAVLLRDEESRVTLLRSFRKAQWVGCERLLDRTGGENSARSAALATLFERLVRGLERSDRQWTLARKKESLQTVLAGSRADAERLQQRLTQLLASWESDTALAAEADAASPAAAPAAPAAAQGAPASVAAWGGVVAALGGSLQRSLPADDARGAEAAEALRSALGRIAAEGATEAATRAVGEQSVLAGHLLQRRNLLLQQMHTLCEELTAGLTDLAEDDSWARGQCDAMREKLAEGLSARGVRSVSALLHTTRTRQQQLRAEREQARDALKSLIHQMLQEVGELGSHTGRFEESVGRYVGVIESADSLESLAGAVREMVAEGRTVHGLVSAAQKRLQDEHAHAVGLTQKVQSLEDELRRLSEEVSTDQLTQIANRRGLLRAFEGERARVERGAQGLAVGLIDVDDFKRLNDRLGHTAGDEALKALAARVQQLLRPSDVVARYGGEEFVVLLPATPVEEAQQVLSRMQRAMTEALFLHEQQPVFITFSAGITAYRQGERLEDALERADEALYVAKRSGKNRTCAG